MAGFTFQKGERESVFPYHSMIFRKQMRTNYLSQKMEIDKCCLRMDGQQLSDASHADLSKITPLLMSSAMSFRRGLQADTTAMEFVSM